MKKYFYSKKYKQLVLENMPDSQWYIQWDDSHRLDMFFIKQPPVPTKIKMLDQEQTTSS